MEDWRMQAACLGQNPAVFIPDESGDARITLRQHTVALAFCERCSVTQECLEWALVSGEELYGIYGNTTPRQRRVIRERRRVHR